MDWMIEPLRKAVRETPRDVYARFEPANALASANRHEKALQIMDGRTRRQPISRFCVFDGSDRHAEERADRRTFGKEFHRHCTPLHVWPERGCIAMDFVQQQRDAANAASVRHGDSRPAVGD
jgi:hypothetical protein